MTLATTLAVLLLIGAIALTVVSVLAYRLYRQCVEQHLSAPQPTDPPAPRLDVPAPHLPPPPASTPPEHLPERPPSPHPAAGSSDGAVLDVAAPAPRTTAPGEPLRFLEYDGRSFVPVDPGPPPERAADDVLAEASPAPGGLAWR